MIGTRFVLEQGAALEHLGHASLNQIFVSQSDSLEHKNNSERKIMRKGKACKSL